VLPFAKFLQPFIADEGNDYIAVGNRVNDLFPKRVAWIAYIHVDKDVAFAKYSREIVPQSACFDFGVFPAIGNEDSHGPTTLPITEDGMSI
jgi:hypothetical protein